MDPRLKLLSTTSWCNTPITGDRIRSLLRTLAEAGPRGLSTGALLAAIWSEEPPAHPTKALQILVSRAKTLTSAEAIDRTSIGYRLALAEDDVDVWALETLISDAEAALASGDTSRALELAQAAIVLSADHRAHRVAILAGARQGRQRQALPELKALSEANPLDEEIAVEYLRALAGVEGPAAALSQFSHFEEHLSETLGSSPGPQLRTIHAELLAMDQPVRAGLRFPSTSLLGRQDDVDKVTGLLSVARLVTIVGPGGLGKTRLAQELARHSPLPHVHVVELATIRHPDELLTALGEALRVREPVSRIDRNSPGQDLRSRVIAGLSTGPNLLVLDNCEHIIEAVASLVNDLLTTVADLRILATSRTPMRLTAEHTYILDQLPTAEAQELFTQRALAARPSVTIKAETIACLVDRLDGLPLAIELAAAKTRTHTPESILQNLTHRFELLRGGDRTAPERHQTLQAVIDWSWQLLGETSRDALMTMSLLPDAFGPDCAEGILGSEAMMTIDNLVDQSLLTVIERDGQIRFRMLETIREYGILRLEQADDRARIEDAVEHWAISTCEEVVPDILGSAQMAAVAVLRAENHNLMHVLRRLLDRGDDRSVIMLAALLPYWMVSGEHIHIVTHFDPIERFLTKWTMPEHLADMTRQMLAVEATTWGMLPRWKDLPATRRLLEQLGSDSADDFIRALTRLSLAIIKSPDPGQQPSSGQSPQDAVRLRHLTDSDDHFTKLLAIPFLSGIKENAGEVAAAISLLEDVMSMLHADDPPWLFSRYGESLSQLHLQFGNFAEAKTHAQRALPILERLGDTVECRTVLAFASLNLGHLDEAEAQLEALASTTNHEEPFGHHHMLIIGQAELALARGHVDTGLALFGKALESGRRRSWMPDMPDGDGLDPWNLVIRGVTTTVWARYARSGHDEQFTVLLDRAMRATAPGRGFYDLPVLGTVAFGLASWCRFRRNLHDDQVLVLLALARRMSFNRTFQSLQWQSVTAGLSASVSADLDEQIDELASYRAAEAVAKFHECVHSIAARVSGSAGTT